MDARFETVYADDGGLPVRVEAATVRGGDGIEYLHHRLVVSDGRRGSVILAQRDGRVLLARSFRAAADAEVWELPRGAAEDGESAVETALRELREETGLTGRSARVLGEYVTDTSVFPQPVAVVWCDVDADEGPGDTDGEVIEYAWVALDRLAALIADGTLADAHSLAAIAIYRTGEWT